MNSIVSCLLRGFDMLFLLHLGTTYQKRFECYAKLAEKDLQKKPFLQDEIFMPEWRKEQQKEWNRLSVMLVLLATASSAALAIQDSTPRLAFSFWLSAAGLSICGLFALQYFAIKALSIDHPNMTMLLRGHHFVSSPLLANAVASPVVMALWASVMFVVGVIDYAVESPMGGRVYMIFALVPVSCAVLSVTVIVVVGEIIDYRVRHAASAVDLEQAPTETASNCPSAQSSRDSSPDPKRCRSQALVVPSVHQVQFPPLGCSQTPLNMEDLARMTSNSSSADSSTVGPST